MPLEILSKGSGRGHWRIICFPTLRYLKWEASGDIQPTSRPGQGSATFSTCCSGSGRGAGEWGQSHNTRPFSALPGRPAVQAVTGTQCVKCHGTLRAQWTQGGRARQPLTMVCKGDRAERQALSLGAGIQQRQQADGPAQRRRGGNCKFYLNRQTSPESFEPNPLT